jgi:hypothetical protein
MSPDPRRITNAVKLDQLEQAHDWVNVHIVEIKRRFEARQARVRAY